MTDSPKTATPKQGAVIIGSVVAVAVVLGLTVLPQFKPQRSKLMGLPAPTFALAIMTGGEPGSRIRTADLKGKVLVLDFWASWCAPCRAEAPILDRVAKRYAGKGVVFLGVDTNDDWGAAVQFVKGNGIGYTTVFDDGDHVSSAFRVQTLPTLVVIDGEGVIRAVRSRMVHEDEVVELITEAQAPAKS